MMKRIAFSLALSTTLLVGSAIAVDAAPRRPDIRDCGFSNDIAQNVTVDKARFVRGTSAKFTISGTMTELVTGGTQTDSLKYLGVPLTSETTDLAQVTDSKGNPIIPAPPGDFAWTFEFDVPSVTPAGTYERTLTMVNSAEQGVMCLDWFYVIE